MHHDFGEAGTLTFQFSPEPLRHYFDAWIFQAFDVVEVRMVQHFQERFHRIADLCVIVNPADFRIDFAFHGNFDLEAVAVHTAAFVAGRRLWQSLRRFKREVFRQPCAHDAQRIINLTPVSSRTKLEFFRKGDRRCSASLGNAALITGDRHSRVQNLVRDAQTPRCVGFQMNLCI